MPSKFVREMIPPTLNLIWYQGVPNHWGYQITVTVVHFDSSGHTFDDAPIMVIEQINKAIVPPAGNSVRATGFIIYSHGPIQTKH